MSVEGRLMANLTSCVSITADFNSKILTAAKLVENQIGIRERW